MAPKRGAATEEENWLDNLHIGVVPTPAPRTNRDYSPRGSKNPELNAKVWESYTTGKTIVVACPKSRTEEMFAELLKARNYLNYIHRDDVPKVDIRGIEKKDFELVDPDQIEDARERTAYRKIIPIGWVGVRFTARPVQMKGRRVQQAKAREAATRTRTAASGSVKSPRRLKAAPPELDQHGVVVPKFSG